MNNLIPVIVTWVKSHVVTTIVVSTVVVGGAVATPIIVNNVKESEPKVEEKQPIKEEVKQPNDSENIEQPTEDEEQPVEDNKEQNKETQKPDNTTKPSTEKPNNNNNKPGNTQPTQPQEEKPTGLSTSNHKVYYNGKEIVSFSVYTMKSYVGEYLPTPVYNANEISSLPSDMKQNLSKYVCEALNGYQGCYYNKATERNEIYHYVQRNNMNFYNTRQDRKKQIDDAEECINYINSPQYQEDINNPNISEWTD